MKMNEILQMENVAIDLMVPSKQRLLQIVSERAAKATSVTEKAIFDALRNREKLGSTGIGEGIALPHAPIADLSTPFAMLVRLARPVDFDSIDGTPVDVVFLLLTPANGQAAYLNILSCIARRLRSTRVMKEVRTAANRESLYSVMVDEAE